MAENGGILIVDADEARRRQLETVLAFVGERVQVSTSAWDSGVLSSPASRDEALPAIVLLGAGVAATGLEQLVQALAEKDATIPILLLGDWPEELTARAMVSARIDWPTDYYGLLDGLHAARVYRDQRGLARARDGNELKLFRMLVGNSGAVRGVRHMMSQVADTDTTVLVLGESGTGKEVVARSLHANSHRRSGPFVPVNCGAIPAELLESELFGHEKGAFTGALSARAGRFELARGGTLFLDEIGDMPTAMQVKLLRVLQERSFERVGGTQSLEADVRIVCATHKNLEEMIAEGSFREDLYYRINVFPIEMPPLRDRLDDLPLLINELVLRLEREQRASVRFSGTAMHSLRRHGWAGNVRELANLVERMAIMHPDGVVGARDLPAKFRHLDQDEEWEDLGAVAHEVAEAPIAIKEHAAGLLPVNGLDLKEYIQDMEKSLIVQALDDCSGVVARAADRLRLRRTTLVEKMRKYELLYREDASGD